MLRFRILDLVFSALICALPLQSALAESVRFGSGNNQFQMEFVLIGDPGNPADTTGNPSPAGSVAYTYRMGKFEVSEEMIDKANAEGMLGITKNMRGPRKPATSITWNEAARFVNWLNTSQNYPPAYKFARQPGEAGYSANSTIELWNAGDAGFDAANPFRNRSAHYWLPSMDEWYKAAFYDPVSQTYFDYPTGGNTAPVAVSSGTTANTAVYSLQSGPADVMQAGGLSPYGTMGQGGNAQEWEESTGNLLNDNGLSRRGVRGGNWYSASGDLGSWVRVGPGPHSAVDTFGFRVASVPEPSAFLLGLFALLGMLLWKWRLQRGIV